MMGDRGAVASVYKEIGYTPEKLGESIATPQPGFLIFRHGRWDDLIQLNKGDNREDFKKIINEIVSLDYQDIDQWDSISFRKWIAQRTSREDVQDWFRAIGHVISTIADYDEMSAGESVYTIKLNLEAMHSVSSGSFIKGGCISLSLPLADYIKQHGGEVRTKVRISRILVEDGKVRGVQIGGLQTASTGEPPPSAADWEEAETILAPIVVDNAPIWGIFDLIPEADLPHWFIRLVTSYRNPDILHSARTGGVGMTLILKEEALKNCFGPYEGREHRVAYDMPYSRGSYEGMIPGANDPTLRTEGMVEFGFSSGGFRPELFKDKAAVQQLFEAVEKDFAVMFPEVTDEYIIEKRSHSRISTPGRMLIDGLGRMPYYTGNFRVDHEGPIEGLYFAGDTVRTRGCGVDAAARSAVWCFNKMMGENVPSFLPT